MEVDSPLLDYITNWMIMLSISSIVEAIMKFFVFYDNASPSTPFGSYEGISFTNLVNLASNGIFDLADINIFGFFTLISILSLNLPFETSSG